MKSAYLKHIEERKNEELPPLALNAQQTQKVVENLINGVETDFYLDLLTNRVPPGVDEAAYVKAGFLSSVAKGQQECAGISQEDATFLLGTMMGGYNITPLIELLDIAVTQQAACDALSNTLLVYEAYQEILDKSNSNPFAKKGC